MTAASRAGHIHTPRFAAYTARAHRIWRVPVQKHSLPVLQAGRQARQVLHVKRQQQSSSTAHAGSQCVCRIYSTHNNRPPAQADAPPLERVPLEAVPAGDVHAVLHRFLLKKPAGVGCPHMAAQGKGVAG